MRTLKFFMIVFCIACMGLLSSCAKTPAASEKVLVVEVRFLQPIKIEYPPCTESVEDYVDEPLHFAED
jgi:hypothetical protein